VIVGACGRTVITGRITDLGTTRGRSRGVEMRVGNSPSKFSKKSKVRERERKKGKKKML